MKFQIKERGFVQGVKRLENGQMRPRLHQLKYPGFAPAKNNAIMSLAPCIQLLSEL